MSVVSVAAIGAHEGQTVELRGWIYNRRSSGKIAFQAERTSKGHADRFWSVVLACQTERGPVGGGASDIGALVVG